MSLTIARMALQLTIRQSTNLISFACLGAALTANPLCAQENSNPYLEPAQQADLGPIVLQTAPELSFTKKKEPMVVGVNNSVSIRIPISNPSQDETVQPVDTLEMPGDKKKEPIRLPTLMIPNTSLRDIGTKSTPEDLVAGRLPGIINLPFGSDRYGSWAIGTKTWIAPIFCHQPTYFEDTMLESHGHERFPCVQPLVSGARFYSGIAFLPYLSYLNPPLRYSPSYDHYRPGSSAPALRQRAPYDRGALRFQLLTTGTTILVGQP